MVRACLAFGRHALAEAPAERPAAVDDVVKRGSSGLVTFRPHVGERGAADDVLQLLGCYDAVDAETRRLVGGTADSEVTFSSRFGGLRAHAVLLAGGEEEKAQVSAALAQIGVPSSAAIDGMAPDAVDVLVLLDLASETPAVLDAALKKVVGLSTVDTSTLLTSVVCGTRAALGVAVAAPSSAIVQAFRPVQSYTLLNDARVPDIEQGWNAVVSTAGGDLPGRVDACAELAASCASAGCCGRMLADRLMYELGFRLHAMPKYGA